jgi:hypothetical protein
VLLYFDEVSALAPKFTESTISFVFTRGRILKMHGIAISQRPQLVNKTIYCESSNVVVFKLKPEDVTGLRRYGLDVPMEVHKDCHAHEYLFYIYNNSEWSRGMPNARGRPSAPPKLKREVEQ